MAKQYFIYDGKDWRIMLTEKPVFHGCLGEPDDYKTCPQCSEYWERVSTAPVIILPEECDKSRVYDESEIEVGYEVWIMGEFVTRSLEMYNHSEPRRIIGHLREKKEETPDLQKLLAASKELAEKGAYWQQQCLAAEKVIELLPPSTDLDIEAWSNWQELKNQQP